MLQNFLITSADIKVPKTSLPGLVDEFKVLVHGYVASDTEGIFVFKLCNSMLNPRLRDAHKIFLHLYPLQYSEVFELEKRFVNQNGLFLTVFCAILFVPKTKWKKQNYFLKIFPVCEKRGSRASRLLLQVCFDKCVCTDMYCKVMKFFNGLWWASTRLKSESGFIWSDYYITEKWESFSGN